MKKTDCFAMTESPDTQSKCGVINRRDCGGCPFYKTREQYDADNDAAVQSLRKKGLEPCIKEEIVFRNGKRISVPIVSTIKIIR